jgi:hypothetical protein
VTPLLFIFKSARTETSKRDAIFKPKITDSAKDFTSVLHADKKDTSARNVQQNP